MVKNYVFKHEYTANLSSPKYKPGVLFAENYVKSNKPENIKVSFVKDKVYINGTLAGQMADITETTFGFLADLDKVIACYHIYQQPNHPPTGGRFVIYKGAFAEYTYFGSGVPIVFSYFGKLYPCKLKNVIVTNIQF